MALSSAAHWNQTEQDWATMLALGRGWGLRQADAAGCDRLVASTLVLPYGARFAWISMVLVLPEARGQGHAGRLLGVALQSLAADQLLAVLDATPAGRPVYLKHGFVDDWRFARWRCAGGGADTTPGAASAGVRRLRESDWPALDALDAPAFGACRLPLLQALAARSPQSAWVAEGGLGLRGYLLGRAGRTALQLGPLVAEDDDVAISLLDAAWHPARSAARRLGRDIVVDLREGRDRMAQWLTARGFAIERPFTRMVMSGRQSAPGDARCIALVAGPELG